MAPEVFEKQDYFRFNEIMLAQPENKREVDVDSLFCKDAGMQGGIFN